MTHKFHRLVYLLLVVFLSACNTVPTPPDVTDDTTQAQQVGPASSNEIINPSTEQVKFAQRSLTTLGYQAGAIDGLWGKRSAQAMQQFEQDLGIVSAAGKLTELNLLTLEKQTGTQLDITPSVATSQNLASKLNPSKLREQTPQLIIIDKKYALMRSANPYSAVLMQLIAGTGVYVLSHQDGWYEIETLSQQRGFISE